MAVLKGYRQFGYDMPGEKVPESRGVLKAATKILDSEGYKLATAEHEPSIMILYAWGDFYLAPNPYTPANPYAQPSSRAMLEFLGATKTGGRTASARNVSFPELDQGLTPLNPDDTTLGGFLPHGLYVITFWAFDFAEAKKGVAKLLWKTNIASSTRGFYLPDVLPTMLTVAAPYFGRETTHPIRVDVEEHYKPRIDLGPLQVIEMDSKTKEHR